MGKQTLLSSFFLKSTKVQNSNSSNAETGAADSTSASKAELGDKNLSEVPQDEPLVVSLMGLTNPGNDVSSAGKNLTVEMDASPISVSDEEQISLAQDEDDYVGLSEYEKLRLRNIKRNHERLVSLGLVDPSTPLPGSRSINEESSRPQRKKRKEGKKINRANTAPSIPVRRSTRNRTALQEKNVDGDALDASLKDTKAQSVDQSLTFEEEKEEPFLDSPLVQYSMESTSLPIASYKSFEGPLASMIPVGPRLSSPQANLALYSLDISSNNDNNPMEWIVGAGKSGVVSIWNCRDELPNNDGIDPIISWKSHGGRWIADAIFVPSRGDLNSSGNSNGNQVHCPSKLLTAANDGSVCLWDLKCSSCSTGAPKNIATTGKLLHKSGIFSMHIDSHGSNYDDFCICTGSKDKTLAVTTLASIAFGSKCSPFFVSHHHTSKVACVQLQGRGSALVGSASDDGSVAIHDYRKNLVVANIDHAHIKPHSIVWNPCDALSFITAGYDDTIHRWDLRNISTPVESYCGHVPLTTKKCKRIHRPCFLSIPKSSHQYILSGSENSSCLSIFEVGSNYSDSTKNNQVSVHSRGSLPRDCGDVGCIVSSGCYAAIAVDGGEVLLIEPKAQ